MFWTKLEPLRLMMAEKKFPVSSHKCIVVPVNTINSAHKDSWTNAKITASAVTVKILSTCLPEWAANFRIHWTRISLWLSHRMKATRICLTIRCQHPLSLNLLIFVLMHLSASPKPCQLKETKKTQNSQKWIIYLSSKRRVRLKKMKLCRLNYNYSLKRSIPRVEKEIVLLKMIPKFRGFLDKIKK